MANSTMNDREKFTEKLLKEWEKVDNEMLVKEVATKGKYINLLLQFLVKRTGKSLTEVRQFFNDEVDQYVHRLLTNQQVHKAELVLKNVGRKPQALFYEFVQSASTEHIDDDAKDRVLEHLQSCDSNFDAVREEYDYYLLVLRLVAANKLLRRQFEDEIHVFTLESLLRKSVEFRQLMACTTCLHCKNAVLVEKLDKHITWRYLWQSEQFEFIIKWLNLLYASKCPDLHEIDGNAKEPCFDIALKNLFSSWDIEPDMFANVESRPDLNECILNGFAQNGMIVSAEKDSIITILQRTFTTGSFVANSSWVIADENVQKILRIIIEQNQLVLLLNDVFRKELIEHINAQYKNDDIELCLLFRNEDFSTRHSIAIVSENCSQYIVKTCDTFFYSKFPHIYLMEQLLLNVSPMILAQTDRSQEILNKISVIDLFLHKLRSTPTVTDYETTLDEMLQLKNIDLNVIKREAFASSMSTVTVASDELITFKNQQLNQKYGHATVLSYLNYVKQYRSAYAVYKFFIDQLDTYSQISQAQIQIACGAVSELAINNLDDVNLIAHCVAFIEMLGINSQTLRAFIKCCQTIKQNAAGDEFNLNGCFKYDDVSKQIEEIILKEIQSSSSSSNINGNDMANKLFEVSNYQALKILCRTTNSDLPISFLKEAAARANWFEFLLFAAFHNYSIRSIVDVCQMDCFKDKNVGLNIGRSLKEIIVEDEMPHRRTDSFSYREHRRKIQTKTDTTSMLNYNHKLMSNSINYLEKLPPTKLHTCQQFLNINDDMDIFAVILICTCEVQLPNEPQLNLIMLRELMKNPDTYQPSTALNLVRYAFKMNWPILSVLAATVNESIIDYCWIIWLIICTELTTIPNEIETFAELANFVITYTVQENYVRTLHQSFEIFYPDSKFTAFTRFLSESSRYQFTAELSAMLMDFLYEIDEGIVIINDSMPLSAEEMSLFVTTLLIECIRRGFDTIEHQQQLLDTIAASGIANHVEYIDFQTIAAINQIVRFTNVRINIDEMICPQSTTADETATNSELIETNSLQNEYNRISDELIAQKAFDNALELADLLNLSKDMIIYEQWIHNFEMDQQFDFDAYDRALDAHSISPLVLINFLLFVAEKLDTDMMDKKYLVLKKILNTIKKHHLYPNEAIPRDRIEYEMYKCVLKNDGMRMDDVEMYYSDYFERCMRLERGVLYKSFLDLKDLAGVDRLTMVSREPLKKPEIDRLSQLMHRLLADGDIVQAIRLHGIFDYRTIDLHYLVFAMALAEGLAHLNDLSAEQKQMLNDGTKQAIVPKFNRRTVRLKRMNTSDSMSASSSPSASKSFFDSVDMNRVDFEEFPPNEKQDVLDAIQNLASRIQYGHKLGQRIAMVFRAAMHLEKEYTDVLQTKDAYILLQNTIDDPCVNRLLVMSDIILSMEMTPSEISNFIAEQVARAIIKSRFYLLHTSVLHSFGQNILWDHDLDRDFHLFLELCPNSSLLGHSLLKYCDALKVYRQLDGAKCTEIDGGGGEFDAQTLIYVDELRTIMENQVLSYKKQNTITVELLIKAHDCFVHECSMEGIHFVLARCKVLTSILAAAKSWRLIVKLLMGVGRYRDMYYCFEILLKNDQFESLLGQFDEERCNGFKDAIIAYLHEYHSDDKENYRLVALHFQMFHELAQTSESEAKQIIDSELQKYEKKMDDEISVASLNLTTTTATAAAAAAAKSPMTTSANDQMMDDDSSGSNNAINTSTLTINGNLSSAIASGVNFLVCSKHLVESLSTAMDCYANAAENYLLDNKLSMAQRAASNAELVAMQIHLIRHALENDKTNCMCVLNIRNEHVFRHLVINELNIPQALILSRAYPYEISWTESIFNQYVIQGKGDYIIEYCVRMELSDDMIEHLVKNFIQMQQNLTAKIEKAISTIIEMVQSVTLRYRLASLLGDKRAIATMINGDCLYYLKDTNYGRNESL